MHLELENVIFYLKLRLLAYKVFSIQFMHDMA